MNMKVGLLHYTGPPVVGGVEQTLYFHAISMLEAGHHPVLIVGEGAAFDPRIDVRVRPRVHSRHPEVTEIKRELDRGTLSQSFADFKAEIMQDLQEVTDDLDLLIVHNVLTLHKNLALTAALFEMHRTQALPPLLGWHHDFAWDRDQYRAELFDQEPWTLLKIPWPGVVNVVVSQHQQLRLSNLYNSPPERIHVISPGFDPGVSGRWTERMQSIVDDLKLLEANLVLLLPARITRRKNIGLAIQVLHEMRRISNLDVRLIIPGPPGPHNSANLAYLDELLSLTKDLSVEESLHFLYQQGGGLEDGIDPATMACLYQFCDGLLFPSQQEGFGIPVLEAGYARLPVFCSDIPPFRESGGHEVHLFKLEDPPESIAHQILHTLEEDQALQLRRRVLGGYTWKAIVDSLVLPLLEMNHGE